MLALQTRTVESLPTSTSSLGQRPVEWQSLVVGSDEILQRFFNGRASRNEMLELKAELRRIAKLDADIGEDPDATVQYRSALDAEKVRMAGRFGSFEKLFQQIREANLRGAPMPDVDFDKLAVEMNPIYGYTTPRASFHPTSYKSFDDWFLRQLAPGVRTKCIAKASKSLISAPVQGKVLQSVLGAGVGGNLTLKVSVIAVDSLLKLIDGQQLIQVGLRKVDYHRIHSPVDGIIQDVTTFAKDQLFPSSEAMTVIEIRCAFGVVKLLCIGEWSVQSFVTRVGFTVPGMEVRKMDELGHFDFGSQVLLVLPAAVRILCHGGDRVFPGDPMCSVGSDAPHARGECWRRLLSH